MISRNQIISEAKSWVGTPFHKQAKKKGIGCDCIGLILGIAENLEIKSQIDGIHLADLYYNDYDFVLDKEMLIHSMKSHLIAVYDQNIATIAVLGSKQRGWHTGIISQKDQSRSWWIHSCAQERFVIEQRFFAFTFQAYYFDFHRVANE